MRGLDDEAPTADIIINNNNNCDLAVNNNNNHNNINNNNNIIIDEVDVDLCADVEANKKPELSKWLESTANFMPSNYNIDFMKNEKRKFSKSNNSSSLCEKELLAAETLVLLKNNFRTKFYNS